MNPYRELLLAVLASLENQAKSVGGPYEDCSLRPVREWRRRLTEIDREEHDEVMR